MERARQTTLRADGLDRPRPDRFDFGHDGYDRAMAAHRRALAAGAPGYADPITGLFVMTAAYLRDRAWCCDRGCRHCPYEAREPTP
ncbi:MAG: DUF5522 domain-containing protein [Actinomycetota bacterium]